MSERILKKSAWGIITGLSLMISICEKTFLHITFFTLFKMKTRSTRHNISYSNEHCETTSSDNSPDVQALFKAKHKRNRKSNGQINFLREEFFNNPSWSKDQVQYISRKTGLSEAQVYKWGWDFRKKLKQEGFSNHESLLVSPEVLYPEDVENSLWLIQKSYRSQAGLFGKASSD